MELIDQLTQAAMKWCVHFNGAQNKTCKAGIEYLWVVPQQFGMFKTMPCIRENNRSEACGLCKFLSEDEARIAAEADEKRYKLTTKCMIEARKDAESRGYKKGSGGQASIACPSGCGGTLRYSVASYNGHLWGKCSTDGCVSWMQ